MRTSLFILAAATLGTAAIGAAPASARDYHHGYHDRGYHGWHDNRWHHGRSYGWHHRDYRHHGYHGYYGRHHRY